MVGTTGDPDVTPASISGSCSPRARVVDRPAENIASACTGAIVRTFVRVIVRVPRATHLRRRRALRLLMATVVWAAGSIVPAHADVVPPRAVEVAERWLALVDRGQFTEAVDRYFERGDTAAANATIAALGGRRSMSTFQSRTIRSWTGHGAGDVSQMAPSAYYSLVYVTVDAIGATVVDEIRLVPHGDDWRVVGHLRSRAAY